MSSFLKPLLSPFRKSHSDESDDTPRRDSQPGPYSTGTNIEAQSPLRKRHFWRRDSSKWSGSIVAESIKGEKPARAEKMGTIYGVFIPTTLNVLSILMYLRVSLPDLYR
jgi:hypothetical protein